MGLARIWKDLAEGIVTAGEEKKKEKKEGKETKKK